MEPNIIDLSHWQGDADFDKMKAAGVIGVLLKCTEGPSYVDPTFAKRYTSARAAGLAVSSYHFLRPGNIVGQMGYYLSKLNPRQGERVVIDYEDPSLSILDLRAAVAALKADSRNLQITVYGGSVLKQQLGTGGDAYLSANTSLWLAHYTTGTPTWPKGTWPRYSLWQYTDKASVPGVSGGVDGNRFNGSDQSAVKWLSPAGPAVDESADGPEAPSVITLTLDSNVAGIKIIVKGGANVEVSTA